MDLTLNIIKWLFLVITSLLLTGVLYEQFCRWSLERTHFKKKTFVEINGVPLHYVKKGTGTCTVVFQSGMGSSYAIWSEIQNSIAERAVTISYDRNGIMFSKSNGSMPTNEAISDELESLLEKTNCPKPYILVGHSMAGIYLRPFIEKNKDDISSIIFAEAAHPQQLLRASEALKKSINIPPRWLIKFVVNTGIYRILFSFVPLSPEMPMNHPLHKLEKDFFYRTCDKVLEEVSLDARNFQAAENHPHFENIPLTVITGISDIRYKKIKDQAVQQEYKSLVNDVQSDLLNLSSNSTWIKSSKSGHLIQINDAQLLIDEIQRSVRSKTTHQ